MVLVVANNYQVFASAINDVSAIYNTWYQLQRIDQINLLFSRYLSGCSGHFLVSMWRANVALFLQLDYLFRHYKTSCEAQFDRSVSYS